MCPDPVEEVVAEETTPETRHPQPRIIEPDMTITSKLKKFFGGNKKAQTIATEIPAQGSSGGGVEPVTAIITSTDATSGTWTGATWEELLSAYNNGVAFATVQMNGGSLTALITLFMSDPSGTSGFVVDLLQTKLSLFPDGTVQILS